MNKILVLGAGRSATSLIDYLIQHAEVNHWQLTVADADLALANAKTKNNPVAKAIRFSLEDTIHLISLIKNHDVVVSLMPAQLHQPIAEICLSERKHLFTASYVSPAMQQLHEKVKQADLLFMNECGLDPGIDHMTAMELMDDIKSEGGKIISFESFTGGLIAPETDPDNPWRYKFTWNPRNVVMAGLGTAKFLEDNQLKYVPHQQLFTRTTKVKVEGIGLLDGYPNRDSLQYKSIYGLDDVSTMIRGTLRFEGYCQAWNVLVQLGVCDESFEIENLNMLSPETFMQAYLPAGEGSAQEKITKLFPKQSEGVRLLEWSGFFKTQKFKTEKATPAKVVEWILQDKWQLQPNDKDLIVMWHRLKYKLNNTEKVIEASLVVKGENAEKTAMADTVGLPLAIAVSLLMQNKIKARGVVIPIDKSIYQPILHELKSLGIEMKTKTIA